MIRNKNCCLIKNYIQKIKLFNGNKTINQLFRYEKSMQTYVLKKTR